MEYQEQSLGGQIFSRIRDDILSRNYTPGEELERRAATGKRLSVSWTPVREEPCGSWIWKVWWKSHPTAVQK